MGFEQIGHTETWKDTEKYCWDFLRDGTDQAACPVDVDGDEYAESILLFIPATQFHITMNNRVLFITLQKPKEMLCTKLNMLVMLLACFITQTKHVNF